MRRFFHVKSIFVLLVGLVLLDSCTVDDNPIPPVFGVAPTVTLLDSTGFITTDAVVPSGSMFFVKVDAVKGDNQMNAIEVQRDGVAMDPNELSINGTAPGGNPALLFNDERDAFTFDVGIMPHASGDALYTIIVTGDGDQTEDAVSLTITVEDASPEVSVSAPGMYIAGANMLAGLQLTVVTNGVDISTIEVLEAGTAISDPARVYLGGVATANQFDANPWTVPANYATGIDGEDMFIRAQSTTATTVTYTIIVTNTAGKSDSTDLTITTSGTDIDATHTGVLLENADGPNATGGMVLLDGTTVSVNSGSANIIDQGNDGNGAWLQQIGEANGSVLKSLSQAQIDGGFDFSTILYREQILDTWNGADATSGVSGTVAVGDVFVVQVAEDFFVIQCSLIEATGNNNLDKYNFDIKVADYQ